MIFAVVIGLHLIHISALGLEMDKDAYLKTENQFSTGECFHQPTLWPFVKDREKYK